MSGVDEELVRAIGGRVRARRKERALTVAGLAESSGISRRFLADVESGRANISVVKLAHLARALGTSAASLLEEPEAGVVALLGLRGAGKSTVGALVARRLAVPFVELDLLVEEIAGLPLPEIFAVHGEAHYRRMEFQALEQFLARGERVVLATGGGIVNSRETFDLLKRGATTVWLRATPEEHMDRVVRQGDRRPIASKGGQKSAMTQLRRILAAREPLYGEADATIDTSGRTPREVATEIEQALRSRGAAV